MTPWNKQSLNRLFVMASIAICLFCIVVVAYDYLVTASTVHVIAYVISLIPAVYGIVAFFKRNYHKYDY